MKKTRNKAIGICMSSWKIYKDVKTYFVTSSIVDWAPIFIDQDFSMIIIGSLKFCSEKKGLKIHAYVIMPDHIHLIVSSEKNLSDIMRDFKGFTSSNIVDLLKRKKKSFLEIFAVAGSKGKRDQNFKVWQSGFHPIAIITEKFYMQKLNYIHENPVKKGYVLRPEYWFYSSASHYAGHKNCPLEISPIGQVGKTKCSNKC